MEGRNNLKFTQDDKKLLIKYIIKNDYQYQMLKDERFRKNYYSYRW